MMITTTEEVVNNERSRTDHQEKQGMGTSEKAGSDNNENLPLQRLQRSGFQ
jgi:hypothetical protein